MSTSGGFIAIAETFFIHILGILLQFYYFSDTLAHGTGLVKIYDYHRGFVAAMVLQEATS